MKHIRQTQEPLDAVNVLQQLAAIHNGISKIMEEHEVRLWITASWMHHWSITMCSSGCYYMIAKLAMHHDVSSTAPAYLSRALLISVAFVEVAGQCFYDSHIIQVLAVILASMARTDFPCDAFSKT